MTTRRREPKPILRTAKHVVTHDDGSVSILIDDIPCRVPQSRWSRIRAAVLVVGGLAAVACGPTAKDAYLRDAANAHRAACVATHPSAMNTFWCEQDEKAFCKANGLEPHCAVGR